MAANDTQPEGLLRALINEPFRQFLTNLQSSSLLKQNVLLVEAGCFGRIRDHLKPSSFACRMRKLLTADFQ
jgi:hypothetical protein